MATCDGYCGSLILRFTFASKTTYAAITAAENAINADPSVIEVTVDGVNGGNPIAPNNVDASNTFYPTPAPTTLPSSSPTIYVECRFDQYVNAGDCVPCPLGTTNAAGDNAAGGDTACDPIECRLDQYVNVGVCVTCPEGTTNAAGDMTSGGDTACDPIELRCTTGKTPKTAKGKTPKATKTAKNSATKKSKKQASKKKAKKGKGNLGTYQLKLRIANPDRPDGNSKSNEFTGNESATPSTSAGKGLLAPKFPSPLCKHRSKQRYPAP